jgi:phosphoglucosamine mutase
MNVGGEQSGHMILSDFATTGDGLVAALQVLATIRTEGRPASEVCRRFAPLPQLLRNVRFSGGTPLSHPDVLAAVGTAQVLLGDTGRILLRPSGTEPLIRVMAEAQDELLVQRVVSDLCLAIEAASPLAAAAD